MPLRALVVALMAVVVSGGAGAETQPTHIALMPMANMSKPADLDFQGGTCDLKADGSTMTCAFQQVFITPVPEDRTACRIVTNHYVQTFHRQADRQWVSREGPEGPCGVMTVTTLEQDARSLSAYWRVTMTLHRMTTAKDAGTRCANSDPDETLASTDARRPLPCVSISAGSLEF